MLKRRKRVQHCEVDPDWHPQTRMVVCNNAKPQFALFKPMMCRSNTLSAPVHGYRLCILLTFAAVFGLQVVPLTAHCPFVSEQCMLVSATPLPVCSLPLHTFSHGTGFRHRLHTSTSLTSFALIGLTGDLVEVGTAFCGTAGLCFLSPPASLPFASCSAMPLMRWLGMPGAAEGLGSPHT